MNKKIILFFSLFLALTSQAQLKKITLEEGVLQQNRKFGTDKLTGFQWIPNTNNYVYYTDAWSKMMSASTADKTAKELVTLSDINTALGTKLKNFFGLEWIDSSSFSISENGKYYVYNLLLKSGMMVQESSDKAENQTFDSKKEYLAFTEANNLYFFNKNKEKRRHRFGTIDF
jgi:dipeptidyl-peptidase-4